jgi:hypothetical protein
MHGTRDIASLDGLIQGDPCDPEYDIYIHAPADPRHWSEHLELS